MADLAENYFVALDPALGFVRLFRTDSPEGAGLSPLWEGLGLRAGYDAMIRLNRDRRPTELHRVCSRPNARGRVAYRSFKGFPPDAAWTVLSEHGDGKAAAAAMSALVAARNGAEAADRQRTIDGLRRAGVDCDRVPRLSPADRRYLEWLRNTGRIAA